MKSFKVLLSLVMMMAVLSASSLFTFAIGFDAEKVYDSVFVIYSGNALGSGFAVGKDCIVTNAHVVENTDEVIVKSYSGEEYCAFVIGIDKEKDIAVLGVEGVEFSYLVLAADSEINIGEDIYAVGAPKSMEYTLTKGVISAQNREIGGNKYLQIDAAINEGNSGGPLLNDDGKVLGINTLKMSDSEGIGLAIPVNTLKDYLKILGLELNEEGNVVGDINSSYVSNESTDKDEQVDNKESELEQDKFSRLAVVIGVIAIVSIFCNILLIIALIYQKQKNLNYKYDPRERTDFDIDILR